MNRSATLKYKNNEYGILVSVFVCKFCNQEFTVCPPVFDEKEAARNWTGCTLPHCKSYDIDRDIDRIWDEIEVIRREIPLG